MARGFAVKLDAAELACRIGEAFHGVTRPKGLTAAQAMDTLDPETRAYLMRGAAAAAGYVAECINAGGVAKAELVKIDDVAGHA